jgi:AraC-like DNA-binding protein
MADSPIFAPSGPVLWRVSSYGRERHTPGRPYWYDNRPRMPAGLVVFQYTLAGQMTFRDHQGPQPVVPGQAALFAYGQASAYGLMREDTKPYECWWVNLEGAGLPEHWRSLCQRHGSVWTFAPASRIEDRLRDLIAQAAPPPEADSLRAARAVQEFVFWLMDQGEQSLYTRQTPVQRAAEQLLHRPTLALSLKRVASLHGCSREHLSRVFRRRTGQSPGAFLARARLRQALRLLRDTDLTITAVAHQAGFACPHTLRRCVRQATGQTPVAYRRRSRCPRRRG